MQQVHRATLTAPKWAFEWNKKNRYLSFNEGGYYFAFAIHFRPKITFHLFVCPFLSFLTPLAIDIELGHRDPWMSLSQEEKDRYNFGEKA